IIRVKQVRRRRLLLWLSATVLFLLCLPIGSWIWTRRDALTTAYKIGTAGISEKSIAVLPLENLTEEKENAYFADGIQDELLSASLALQGDLATVIAAGAGWTLSPQEKERVTSKPTNNPAAYDAYLRARGFPGGSHQEGAIRLFQEAVKLDPNFVLAWAFLSS